MSGGIKDVGEYNGKNKTSQLKNTQKQNNAVYCYKCNWSNHNKCNFKFKTSKYRTCQLIATLKKFVTLL